jgi:transcriptional regulator with XRE-family HTH domain
MNMVDIGRKVKEKRVLLNLSQAKLASLSKVSRITINAMENAQLKEIGITKLLSIMKSVDMTFDFKHNSEPNKVLIQITNSANVSYKHALTPTIFKNALVKATMPKKYIGNMMYFFDEAPESMVNKTIQAIATLKKMEPIIIKNNAKKIAQKIKSPRSIWYDTK